MSNSYTDTNIPYSERNFIVDDSDKELFIMMKSIVDAGFPEAVDPMLLELYKQCWLKKRKIRYKEVGDSTVYIDFPKMNPLLRLFGAIALRFTSKE